MKLITTLTLVLGLALAVPGGARADGSAKPAYAETKEARFVPAVEHGVPVGLKVYAIRAGGRLDQPQARLHNGDVLQQVDGISVLVEAGAKLLVDKVLDGHGDADLTVEREGQVIHLASKASAH